jgi:hypothetical protein
MCMFNPFKNGVSASCAKRIKCNSPLRYDASESFMYSKCHGHWILFHFLYNLFLLFSGVDWIVLFCFPCFYLFYRIYKDRLEQTWHSWMNPYLATLLSSTHQWGLNERYVFTYHRFSLTFIIILSMNILIFQQHVMDRPPPGTRFCPTIMGWLWRIYSNSWWLVEFLGRFRRLCRIKSGQSRVDNQGRIKSGQSRVNNQGGIKSGQSRVDNQGGIKSGQSRRNQEWTIGRIPREV